MPKKPKPKIEEVTRDFGEAHAQEAHWKHQMERNKKLFYDLIVIPDSELATQVIYCEGDPDQYVASFYPKWRIVKKEVTHLDDDGEWRVIIQEDPTKKTFTYQNPLDGKVYQRTVAESAPEIDLERLAQEKPGIYKAVTFQPKPPRELKPLERLTDDQKIILMRYLLPPKLTNRMEKPRQPKEDE